MSFGMFYNFMVFNFNFCNFMVANPPAEGLYLATVHFTNSDLAGKITIRIRESVFNDVQGRPETET